MSRINILPYAYIESGWVYMFRTCPKYVQQLPEELFGFGQTICTNIFTNRKGVRMLECHFKIDPNWRFCDIVHTTESIKKNLTEYLKNRK